MNGTQTPSLKPHRATLILVLGILGLVICAPCGIAAWIMGNGDIKEMNAGLMDPSGRGMTNAGRICGMIASILLIVGVLIFIAAMAFGILGGISSQGG